MSSCSQGGNQCHSKQRDGKQWDSTQDHDQGQWWHQPGTMRTGQVPTMRMMTSTRTRTRKKGRPPLNNMAPTPHLWASAHRVDCRGYRQPQDPTTTTQWQHQTHHLPPAPWATACGVDHRWNDNDNAQQQHQRGEGQGNNDRGMMARQQQETTRQWEETMRQWEETMRQWEECGDPGQCPLYIVYFALLYLLAIGLDWSYIGPVFYWEP